MICEKCWGDAYMRHLGTGKSQYDCYRELLEERKDNPCPVVETGKCICVEVLNFNPVPNPDCPIHGSLPRH